MNEETLRHLVVRLDHRWNVPPMNTNRDTHVHVLWCLDELSIDTLQITLLECLETEIPKIKITIGLDVLLHLLSNFGNFIGDDTSLLKLLHREVEVLDPIGDIVKFHILNTT